MENNKRELRGKAFTGTVVSDKMQKTVVVRVDTHKKHTVYTKRVKRAIKVKAHDGDNKAKTGDRVRILETRPMSKEKRWRVVEVIPGKTVK